jgi:pyridoxal phosphate enzyme (YggS family)
MSLAENLAHVESRILAACQRAGRSREDVTLVAVSKFHPVSAIRELYELGVRDFGESRVQELLDKRPELPRDINWHFIGPLQSNKAKYLSPFVHLVHAVESISGLEELEKQASAKERELDVLIQVNISREEQKHGVDEPELLLLIDKLIDGYHLRLRGLMGMASFESDPENTREQFRRLKLLHTKIRTTFPHIASFSEMSMGMTNDFEIAIEEGSTIVRIGSALFGERS